MIKAKIYEDRYKNIIKYSVVGHAGFADKGFDIVCAAVSILAQTALISLNSVCKIDEKDIDYYIDDTNGILQVTLPNDLGEIRKEKANTVLRAMEVGLISIMENYPGNVILEYEEV